MVEPIFAKSEFSVTSGHPAVYRHRSAGSGKMVDIHFCRECGTKLHLSFERFPDIVGVYAGTFDDPNWFPRAPETSRHIVLDVAQIGTVIPAGVNAFRQHTITNDETPTTPHVFDKPHTVGAAPR